ncbi:hypothetical protein HDU76_001247 [Blyttiomyces sp. JEL0837]|nr:hypothetical protein HDU76_001247 [Blyttiomyces sp. JEL0837]
MGEPISAYESTLHELSIDPNHHDQFWSASATIVLFRKRLLENNPTEALAMMERLYPEMKQSGLQDAGYQSKFYFTETFAKLVQGEIDQSIQLFHRAIEGAKTIHSILPTPLELLWTSSVFIWLLIDPERSGIAINRSKKLTYQNRIDLLSTLKDAVALTKNLGEKLELIPMWWAMKIYEAGLDVLKGQPAKASQNLLKGITSNFHKGEIEEMKLMFAMCCGIVGKYSGVAKEREAYKGKARGLFIGTGAQIFVQWLQQ